MTCEFFSNLLNKMELNPSISHLVNLVGEKNAALRCAAEYGDIALVRRLLDPSKPWYQAVREGITVEHNYLLGIAVDKNHPEVVEDLLTFPEVVQAAREVNNITLAWAAFYGHKAVVLALLAIPELAAIAHCEDNRALAWALGSGHVEIVEYLLALECVRQNLTHHLLENAIIDGRADMADYLDRRMTALGITMLCESPENHPPSPLLFTNRSGVGIKKTAEDIAQKPVGFRRLSKGLS